MPHEFSVPVTDPESESGSESVAAIHHESPSDDWLVFCHGFRSDKSGSYERRCRRAVEEGYNGVRFDFRGCGDADGDFVEQSLGSRLADLEAVLDVVVDAPEAGSVVLFGSSFGGKVAFHAADDDRVDAVATRAPVTATSAFDRCRDRVAARGEYEFDTGERIDERFFDDLVEYPFEDVAGTLDVPVAIFHGARDESVPVGDSIDAARALETDVLLQVFEREGHLFSTDSEERLLDLLFAWLATDR